MLSSKVACRLLTIALAAFIGCATSAFATQKTAQVNGLTLAYESFGRSDRQAVLLIAGSGAQLTSWPAELCEALVKRGYRVIVYDSRDIGLSSKLESAGPPDWPKIIQAMAAGTPVPLPYTVDDMAKDAIGLLHALGIEKAHIAGASGGAIVAQLVAAQYPQHVLSLTTMMATTGNPALPPMKPAVQKLILAAPLPSGGDISAIVDRQVRIFQAIGSPAYPTDEKLLRDRVLRATQRSYYPDGDARQAAAALAAGDRRAELRRIAVPTVVVHGADDSFVPVEAGRDVAAAIPGADLRVIDGMGHDIPAALIDTIADAIAAAAVRGRQRFAPDKR